MSVRGSEAWSPRKGIRSNFVTPPRSARRPRPRVLPYSIPDFITKCQGLGVATRPDEPYFDIHETADVGMCPFSVTLKDGRSDTTSRCMLIRRTDRHSTKIHFLSNKDLTGLEVTFAMTRSLQNQVLVMFDPDDKMPIRNEMLGKSLMFKLFSRLTIDGVVGAGIHTRYFSTDEITQLGGMRKLIDAVNKELSRPLMGLGLMTLSWHGLEDFQYETLGQLLVAMFSARRARNPNSRGGPLRQVLSFLVRMCLGDDSVRHLLIASVYAWAYLGTCNSCFDKVLHSQPITDYKYSMVSLSAGLSRPLSVVETPDLSYVILKHDDVVDHIPTAWKVFEHSHLCLKNAKSTIQFQFSERGDFTDTEFMDIPVHWGMSFLQLMRAAHRGVKSALHGRGNEGVISAVRSLSVYRDDFAQLKEMLVDTHLIAQRFPRLSRLCRNLIGIIATGSVAPDLLPIDPGANDDIYGSLMMNMLRHEVPFYVEVCDFLCPYGSSDEELRRNLDDARIRNVWIMYINEPSSSASGSDSSDH